MDALERLNKEVVDRIRRGLPLTDDELLALAREVDEQYINSVLAKSDETEGLDEMSNYDE